MGAVGEVIGRMWERLWGQEGIEALPIARGSLQSGSAGLKRIGPLGQTLDQMLQLGKDNIGKRVGTAAAYYAPKAEEAMKGGLTSEIIGDLERKVKAKTPLASELADYSRIMREALYQEAQQVGIKVGPRTADDLPHMWDPKIFEGSSRQSIIDHLTKTGQASSRHDAEVLIDQILERKGRVHTLESPRQINLPGYRTDLAVPFDHIKKSMGRIEWAKIFGPKNENLNMLLDQIAKENGSAAFKYADLVSSSVMGNHGLASDFDMYTNGSWMRRIASVEALQHLSLAFLRHSGQFLNTTILASRAGLTPTVKAMAHMISDYGSAKEFALQSGAIMPSIVREFRRLAGQESETLGQKLLRYTPFNYIDKLRRVFAANVGEEYVKTMAQRLAEDPNDLKAIRGLRLMGVDPDDVKKAGVTDTHILQAAKRMSDLTQFESDAQTLPPRWMQKDEPLMRLAVMYKQFFFHQARFVKDQVLKPAILEGEMKPLIYMATLFPTFGEMVADINELARKGNLKDRPQHVVERLIDNYASIGGFGIMHDMIYAFAQPQKEAAMRFVVGPAISDAVDIARIPGQKHPIEEVEKRILRSIPVVGPIATKKVFPPKTTPQKGPLQRGAITRQMDRILGVKLP